MALYQQYHPSWWTGRNDGDQPEVLRWHQIVKGLNLEQGDQRGFAFLGFECDEGVRRNHGRPGAVNGPEHIQRALSNLPVHTTGTLCDAGNVLCDNDDLEGAQRLLGIYVAKILATGCMPIVLGGGHEVAYGHFLGLREALPGKKIGIINIDAHFDLRPLRGGKGNSGTSFTQIYERTREDGTGFHYMVLGVQDHGNTRSLFDTAKALSVTYFRDTEITHAHRGRIDQSIQAFADKVDVLYLTICMDAFNVAYAPGVSAVNVRGLQPDHNVFAVLKTIAETNKLVSLDIAEVNPAFDEGERTSRLAALLIFEITRMLEASRED